MRQAHSLRHSFLLWLLTGTACTDVGSAPDHDPVVGTRLLAARCESIETSTSPVVTVGELGGGGISFGEVEDGALFADGGFVVIDDLERTFSIFDSTGTRTGQAGGEGEGPGDFLAPASVSISGDTIIIWDMRLNRWSYFDRGGSLLGTERFEPSTRASVIGRFADGSVVTARGTPFEFGEMARDTLILERYAPLAPDSATQIGRFPWSTKFADLSRGFSVFTAPFSPQTSITAWTAQNVIAVGTAERPSIRLIPLGPEEPKEIPVPLEGPEVSDDMVSEWKEEHPAAVEAMGELDSPDTAPPYASIHADQAGFVWVKAEPGSVSRGTRFVVLREDGFQVEDLRFRGDADLLWANERYALLRKTDELDVGHAELYRRECSRGG